MRAVVRAALPAWIAALALLPPGAGQVAAQKAPVPLSAFFDNPAMGAAKLSPDGRHVAATVAHPSGQGVQKQVDAILPGTNNMIDVARRPRSASVLVTSVSDVQPRVFSLYDTDSGQLHVLGRAHPAIATARMAPKTMVRYTARDGLVTKPLLLAYGGEDRWVPPIHGTLFRDAVRKNNPNVEWVLYYDGATAGACRKTASTPGPGWKNSSTSISARGETRAIVWVEQAGSTIKEERACRREKFWSHREAVRPPSSTSRWPAWCWRRAASATSPASTAPCTACAASSTKTWST